MQLYIAGFVSGDSGMCDKTDAEKNIKSEPYCLYIFGMLSIACASVCVTGCVIGKDRRKNVRITACYEKIWK